MMMRFEQMSNDLSNDKKKTPKKLNEQVDRQYQCYPWERMREFRKDMHLRRPA